MFGIHRQLSLFTISPAEWMSPDIAYSDMLWAIFASRISLPTDAADVVRIVLEAADVES